MVDTELGGVVAPRFFFYEEDPMNYKGFHHLTWNDRLTIEKMLKVHTAKAKIAEALGVSVRTIYYEIKRGMCTQRNTDYTVEDGQRDGRTGHHQGAPCPYRTVEP